MTNYSVVSRTLSLLILSFTAELLVAQTPAAPVFSLSPGAVTCPFTLRVSDSTPGARLLITTDLSMPSASAAQMQNPSQSFGGFGPMLVVRSTTFKAVAVLPAGARPTISDPVSRETDATYTCRNAVWGFADLHSHPASHLAFGADANGQNGLFWGKPAHDGAMDLATSSLPSSMAADLPSCAFATTYKPLGATHNASTSDWVKLETDSIIVSTTDATAPGFTHQWQGYPSFQSWPSALSVDHQVMHINNIKRAFDGGLRLLFASVTDDEVIDLLWNQGANLFGNSKPQHDPSHDFTSASRQLTYITNLVNANRDWMTIVHSPAEARAAINSNPPKLAVVLSLEMDSLSLDQVETLVQQFGVAHVTPIHLADNSFGGTAIYSDTFNGLSNFLNGFYYSPQVDPNVEFWLGSPPPSLQSVAGSVMGYSINMPQPGPVRHPGELNSRGLNTQQFISLMQMGLLIDLAHMGYKSAGTALAITAPAHYPLMDSHTGLRCDGPNCSASLTPYGAPPSVNTPHAGGINERSLPTSQVAILRQMGGVIGMGVVPMVGQFTDQYPVATWVNNYSIALSLMGGRGVALGTDANGLSPMISHDTVSTGYPITVASQFGCPTGCPTLAQYKFGNRTYDFLSDGIANYGLLPDFIQAASKPHPIFSTDQRCINSCNVTDQQCLKNWDPKDYPKGTQCPCGARNAQCQQKCTTSTPGPAATAQIQALFHSAEDTLAMWDAVQNALVITTPPTATQGSVGTALSKTFSARGGFPPYSWSLYAGSSLPPGMSLSAGGSLSGAPTTSGTYSFTVVVEDTTAPVPLVAGIPYSITVTQPPCGQAKNHVILVCSDGTTVCAIPPAKPTCPTPHCTAKEVLQNNVCVPKGGHEN